MRSVLLCAAIGVSAVGLPLAGPSAARADEARATIRVTLPADATLTIDGQPTRSTSADRAFVTPPLEAGKDFYYTLRAGFARRGETLIVERRVAVRAGQETSVSLGPPGASEVSRTYYYVPASPPAGGPSVVLPGTVAPGASPLPADVGGARDNWKPDASDPFYIPSGW